MQFASNAATGDQIIIRYPAYGTGDDIVYITVSGNSVNISYVPTTSYEVKEVRIPEEVPIKEEPAEPRDPPPLPQNTIFPDVPAVMKQHNWQSQPSVPP